MLSNVASVTHNANRQFADLAPATSDLGDCGANDEFLLAATAQNLRKLAKILPAPQKTKNG